MSFVTTAASSRLVKWLQPETKVFYVNGGEGEEVL